MVATEDHAINPNLDRYLWQSAMKAHTTEVIARATSCTSRIRRIVSPRVIEDAAHDNDGGELVRD
jgi:hypothetical protein